ncbi:unnamed protein product [Symbiodinium necroappetens]|uniref:Uncharacterized protein n=1 Tax=Symbiodinium necroappetens TaxID=1628268 RepID=A0A813A836_9DINO|nr:unnamed protein product [Symbiodinium necroappetens]
MPGDQSLASAWESCSAVRGRFRRELPWLQWPIPGKDAKPGPASSSPDPHFPCTRALELNAAVLTKMLDVFSGEFLDIAFLTKQDPAVAELFRRVEAIRANIQAQQMEVDGDEADDADLYEDDGGGDDLPALADARAEDGGMAAEAEEAEAMEAEAVEAKAVETKPVETTDMETTNEETTKEETVGDVAMNRYRSKRSIGSIESVTDLASPGASTTSSEFAIPTEMTEEQKEELAQVLEQINQLNLERNGPSVLSPASTESPTPSATTPVVTNAEVPGNAYAGPHHTDESDDKTGKGGKEPISPDQVETQVPEDFSSGTVSSSPTSVVTPSPTVVAPPSFTPDKVDRAVTVTVTPAMQREKAASKRVKGRRGPGKRGSKCKRVRKARDSGARSSKDIVDVGADEALVKKGAAKATAKAKAKSKKEKPVPAPADGAAKDEPRPRKGRKPKVPEGESPDHDVQRHIWLSETRWVYEILPNQKFGCGGCRFLWFGCKACQKETFRGRNCEQMKEDPAYLEGLAAASGEAPEATEEIPAVRAPTRAKKAKKAKNSPKGDV